MQPYWQGGGAVLYLGDCRAVLPTLPTHSVDAIVTDPPAGIEFMGKEWDTFKQGRLANYTKPPGGTVGATRAPSADLGERLANLPNVHQRANRRCQQCRHYGYSGSPCRCAMPDWAIDTSARATFIAQMTAVFTEARRVLKPAGHALVWSLPRTSHWTATALEDAGFEIRDCITHLFGTGFPKSKNLDGDWAGYGTALKPSAEFWWLARAPLSEPTIAQNVARWGTGALNVDGCRIGTDSTIRPLGKKMSGGQYGAHAQSMQGPVGYSGGSPSGRWPANCVLSHTPECRIISAGQRPYEVNTTWGHGENLCASCAAPVGERTKPATQATKVSTVTSNAEPTTNGRARNRRADTNKADTGCSRGTSAGATSTSLSTATSGGVPMAQYHQASLFTTETRTNSTTASKTCNSCGEPIMSATTTAQASPTASTSVAGVSGTPSTRLSMPSVNGNGAHANGQADRWACHESCPVRLLDAQSGVTSTTGRRSERSQSAVVTGTAWGVNNHRSTEYPGESGGASRFYYVAKPSARERSMGLPPGERNQHPTVKSISLCRWLVRLITPPGGTVLDPFMGSGSIGCAALQEGMEYIGVEQEREHCDTAAQRIGAALPLDVGA